MPKAKYHSRKIRTWDGVFDSRREYERWIELKAMERAGMITDLKRQAVFVLLPKQTLKEPRIDRKGKKHLSESAVKYIADFTYTQNGERIVEDVKGMCTPEYIIKRKMLLKQGVQIKEVY